MEIAFDTEISTQDIQDVNRLRFWMNQCFVVEEGMDRLSEDCSDVLKAQQRIKESLYGYYITVTFKLVLHSRTVLILL